MVAQFVKAVRVKRDYEINVEFHVSFDEFQQIYLEPEKERENVKGAATILALAEKSGQAVQPLAPVLENQIFDILFCVSEMPAGNIH